MHIGGAYGCASPLQHFCAMIPFSVQLIIYLFRLSICAPRHLVKLPRMNNGEPVILLIDISAHCSNIN